MVVGQLVYIGSCAGRLYALDVDSGTVVWSFDTSPDGASQFHGKPLIVDSLIIFGTDEGRRAIGTLYAIHRQTGALIWKNTGEVGLPSNAALGCDSLIYIVTRRDELRAHALSTGVVLWRFATGWSRDPDLEPATNIQRPRTLSSPLFREGQVYFIGRDSTLYCLEGQNGHQSWVRRFADVVTSEPLMIDDRLVVGLGIHELHYINLTNGEVTRIDSLPHLAHDGMAWIDNLIIYLGGFEDQRPQTIEAFDVDSSVVRWSYRIENTDAYWYVPRIHLWDDQVIVGSTKGQVLALQAATGTPLWQFKLDEAIRGIGNGAGRLFVGTFSGMLYAVTMRR